MKKNITNIVIILAIVAVGIAIMAFAHFNWSLYYSKNVRVEIYLGEKFEIATVANYIQEILPEQEVIVETAGAFKDTISFSTTQISDEQVQQINATGKLPPNAKFVPNELGGYQLTNNFFGIQAGTQELPAGFEVKKNILGFTTIVPKGTKGMLIKDN